MKVSSIVPIEYRNGEWHSDFTLPRVRTQAAKKRIIAYLIWHTQHPHSAPIVIRWLSYIIYCVIVILLHAFFLSLSSLFFFAPFIQAAGYFKFGSMKINICVCGGYCLEHTQCLDHIDLLLSPPSMAGTGTGLNVHQRKKKTTPYTIFSYICIYLLTFWLELCEGLVHSHSVK